MSYTLQVSTNSSFTNFIYNQNGLTETSLQISGLSSHTVYYWRASSHDNLGNTVWSNPWSFSSGSPCNDVSSVPYQEKIYNTVQIGTKCYRF
jgi:hypothetical protein